MTGITSSGQDYRVAVVDESVAEILSVVAERAIVVRCRVRWSRRLADCINTVVPVVAFRARLGNRIDDGVVEVTVETEGLDAMACTAIDGRYRMAVRLAGRRNTMTGITPVTHDFRAGVVGEGTLKTCGRMTQCAFRVGIRVRGRGRFTCGHSAVVASRTRSRNTRMIKAAVQL